MSRTTGSQRSPLSKGGPCPGYVWSSQSSRKQSYRLGKGGVHSSPHPVRNRNSLSSCKQNEKRVFNMKLKCTITSQSSIIQAKAVNAFLCDPFKHTEHITHRTFSAIVHCCAGLCSSWNDSGGRDDGGGGGPWLPNLVYMSCKSRGVKPRTCVANRSSNPSDNCTRLQLCGQLPFSMLITEMFYSKTHLNDNEMHHRCTKLPSPLICSCVQLDQGADLEGGMGREPTRVCIVSR